MGKVTLKSANHAIWAVQGACQALCIYQQCQTGRINQISSFDHAKQVKSASAVRRTAVRAWGASPLFTREHPHIQVEPPHPRTGITQPLPNNIPALTVHLHLLLGRANRTIPRSSSLKEHCKAHCAVSLKEIFFLNLLFSEAWFILLFL